MVELRLRSCTLRNWRPADTSSLSRHADELNITALHLFTFNSIETTAAWQRKSLA